MSMEFRRLIDKEDIILDSKMLAEFNERSKLNEKIDKVMWDFLHENNMDLDNDKVAWIRNYTNELKDRL